MKLQWKDAYSVGNEKLDEQHKHWINLYNQLDDVMTGNSRGELGATRSGILQKISDYVDYHFQFEEEFMREIGYPGLEKHWEIHKNFRNEVYRICREHIEGTIILNSEIMDMIRHWLVEHIVKQDTRIMEFLLAGPGKTIPAEIESL